MHCCKPDPLQPTVSLQLQLRLHEAENTSPHTASLQHPAAYSACTTFGSFQTGAADTTAPAPPRFQHAAAAQAPPHHDNSFLVKEVAVIIKSNPQHKHCCAPNKSYKRYIQPTAPARLASSGD
jgi:hypothetical protein